MLRWLIPLALVAGLHYAVWALLTSGLPPLDRFGIGLGLYLAFSAVLIPAGLLTRRLAPRGWFPLLAWSSMLALGLFSSLFVLSMLRAIALPVLAGAGLPVLGWLRPSAWAVPSIAVLATVGGLWVARARPAIVRVDIPIDGLPLEFEGYRIVQITDIHVGPTIRRDFVRRIVEAVNRLEADLVAITGDVVDGAVSGLRDQVAPLGDLKAGDRVALVLGNHELYSGVSAWVEEFRRLGLAVLLNEHFVVRRGNAALAVAGVTDHSTVRFVPELACDAHAAIRGEGAGADVKVLLAHQPLTAAEGADAGFHLALHGHTHGGQWWPWNHFVRIQQPVVSGLHRIGTMWSYTSIGTGYWGPPKRHFRSEITVLTLRQPAT